MDVLITICMVIAGLALIGAAIYFFFWIAMAAGIVALVALAFAEATGLSFWPSFWIVAIVAVVGYVLLNIFGEI